MFTALLTALGLVFKLSVFLHLIAGTLLGMIFGMLPGLTATLGIAILAPLTMFGGFAEAMAMLMGMYNAAIYGGSIAAIMVNTPGTPASFATTLDGFPMAQRGEAGKAIATATTVSALGGLFGVIVLSVAAFPIANFALRFGPPEYFALILFGICMMVSVVGKSVLKGLLVGFLGLAIGTIGMDPVFGVFRLSFGISGLQGGISFIAIMIGLFGLGEALYRIQIMGQEDTATGFAKKISRSIPSWPEIKGAIGTFFLSAPIGVAVGAVPAVGGDIAGMISWDQAKRFSRTPEKYGTGYINGVVATETANNASIGGAMCTVLTLGIPGDMPTAVLIGALLMHGVTPGPMLFLQSIDYVYLIIGCLVLSNLAFLAIGLLSARFTSKINILPSHILWPIVVLLCCIGSYSIGHSFTDMSVMLIGGAIGWLLRNLEIPPAPMVIGVLLGPMAECNLCRTLQMSSGDWSILFTRPISVFFLLVSVAVLVITFIQRERLKAEKASQ